MSEPSRLLSAIVELGFSSLAELEEAQARQLIYGGDLELNLIELGLLSEGRLATARAHATGLSAAAPGPFAIRRPLTERLRQEGIEGVVERTPSGRIRVVVSRALDASEIALVERLFGETPFIELALDWRLEEALVALDGRTLSRRFREVLETLGSHVPFILDSPGGAASTPAAAPTVSAAPRAPAAPPAPAAPTATTPAASIELPPALAPSEPPSSRAVSSSVVTPRPPSNVPILTPSFVPPPDSDSSPNDSITAPPPLDYEQIATSSGTSLPGPGVDVLPTPGVDGVPTPEPLAPAPRGEALTARVQEARHALQLASNRDAILKQLLIAASHFFEYTALFAIAGKEARGLRAQGPGASSVELPELRIPLDLASPFAKVVGTGTHHLARLRASGVEGGIAQDLKRPTGHKALFLPIAVRGRPVLLLFGDRGDEDVTPSSLVPLFPLLDDVTDALERVLVERKRQSMIPMQAAQLGQMLGVAKESDVVRSPSDQPPTAPSYLAPPQKNEDGSTSAHPDVAPPKISLPSEFGGGPLTPASAPRASQSVFPPPQTDAEREEEPPRSVLRRETPTPFDAALSAASFEATNSDEPLRSAPDVAPAEPAPAEPTAASNTASPSSIAASSRTTSSSSNLSPSTRSPSERVPAPVAPLRSPKPHVDTQRMMAAPEARLQSSPPPQPGVHRVAENERFSLDADPRFPSDAPRTLKGFPAAQPPHHEAPAPPPEATASPSAPLVAPVVSPRRRVAIASTHDSIPPRPSSMAPQSNAPQSNAPQSIPPERSSLAPQPSQQPPAIPQPSSYASQSGHAGAESRGPVESQDAVTLRRDRPIPREEPAGAPAFEAPEPEIQRAAPRISATLVSRGPLIDEPPEEGWGNAAPRARGSGERAAVQLTYGDLVDRLLTGDRRALEKLVDGGESAVAVLISRFPGPVKELENATAKASNAGPILEALVALGARATPFLTVRTADEDANVRRWAVLVLGEIPSRDSARAIAGRLLDTSSEVRRAALISARRLQSDTLSRRTLRSQIEEVAVDVRSGSPTRAAAIEALADIREHAAIPTLLQILGDKDRSVARAAQWALSVLTRQDFGSDFNAWRDFWQDHRDEPRIEWLIASLEHAQAEIRRAALDEIRSLSGTDFGYAEASNEPEKNEIRQLIRAWWKRNGSI